MAKEVIYVDIEDDISGIINKVESAKDKVVALVLPKHASVFLSTINMKLLKKAADTEKKSIVLITSDTSILPLATVAGLHTAKSLNAKPVLAKAAKPKIESNDATTDDLDDVQDVPSVQPKQLSDDALEIDNTQKLTKTLSLGKKNHKLKVPNFTSFRLRVFLLGFGIVALIVGWVFAFIIMPKATITLKTDVSTVASDITFTANAALKDFDPKVAVLPATAAEVKKTDTDKTAATGKKDKGTKATGSMTVVNCTDNDVDVPAGTAFSSGGFSFSLDSTISVPASDFFSPANGGACKENGKMTGTVTALAAGGSSNLSAGREYVSSFASTVTGIGGAMGGGTSNMVTVVSAEDIESAKQKLLGKSKTAAISELTTQLESKNLLALSDTLTEAAPVVTVNAAVDAEVLEVSATSITSYTMLGVSQDNINALIEADVTTKITDSKQKILDNGAANKKITFIEKKSPTEQKLGVSVSATVGPDINISGIATETAGKSRGDIQRLLSNRAGVKEVTIKYEPFWVTKTPNKPGKIKVVVEQQVNAK